MRWLLRSERLISRILEAVVTICLACIFLLVTSLVVLRYGFNTTIIGANEFVVILFIYTSGLGAAIIVGKKQHIAITYFIDKLPISLRKTVDVLSFLLIAFINGVMIIYSIQWISKTGHYLTAALRIPQLYAQVVIPIGCGAAILYCLYHVVIAIVPKER